jgi:hypothetical protein
MAFHQSCEKRSKLPPAQVDPLAYLSPIVAGSKKSLSERSLSPLRHMLPSVRVAMLGLGTIA